MLKRFSNILFLLIPLAIFSSCQKLEISREIQLQNDSILDIKSKSAVIKAAVTDIGDGVLNHGHCWSVNQIPTVLDEHSDFLGRAGCGDRFDHAR